MVWLVWSNIRKSLDAEKAEILIKICRFYIAEEDNQKNLLKLFELFFCFSNPPNFVAFRFVSLKINLQ